MYINTEVLIGIQKIALDHYDRMIAWVETQPAHCRPSFKLMYADIREDWFGSSCVYCKVFCASALSVACLDKWCPLSSTSFLGCCNGLWGAMANTPTWGEFLIYAKKVREYIKENGLKLNNES